MAHENRLSNRTVLIFGGTSGIGFGIANMVLSNNANVVISGSRQPKVDDKVALLRSFYPNLSPEKVTGHALDLLDAENMEANLIALFEKVTDGGKKPIDHIAFTAVAPFKAMPLLETVTPDMVFDGFKVRFTGPLIIGKIVKNHPGKYLALSYQSSITMTGGTNSTKPMPGWAVGAGWGGATEALAKGMAVDLKPIRVNQVEPGVVQTELLQGFLDNLGPEGVEKMKREHGLTGQLGQPGDLAETYGWFMRDWFVTGKNAASDGGRLLA